MNKSLFVLPVLALLTACQPSISTSLEQDKQWLFSCPETEYGNPENYFSSQLINTIKDDDYLITYQIDKLQQDFQQVKVIITPDEEHSYFFGYDQDYKLVKDVEKQDSSKHIYSGIKISFVSQVRIEKLKVLFKSSDLSLVYEIHM